MEEKLRDSLNTGMPLNQAGSRNTGMPMNQAGSRNLKDGDLADGNQADGNLADAIRAAMQLPDKDWSQYPPLSLAWIGDTVYDLIVRSILLCRGTTQPDRLHKKASSIVNARAQAAAMERIREKLTEQERAICRRGHNAKPAHKAKNADMDEYLEATAFECLMGYLYLTGQYKRLMELVRDELNTVSGRSPDADRY